MPADADAPDTFIPVTRDEVSDNALLPRRFDVLARELRELTATLKDAVIPAIQQVAQRVEEIARENRAHRSELSGLQDRVDDLHGQLARLVL